MGKELFEAINTYGQVAEETDHYIFYQLAEVKDRYDSNFMKLRAMPNTKGFELLVEELKVLVQKYGNPHGKIVFPENCKPVEELIEKAKELGFEWSFLEMYEVEPGKFKEGNRKLNSKLQVRWITSDLIDDYGQIHYEETVEWGETYAASIRSYKKELIERGDIRVVVALLEGEIVGTTDVIFTTKHVEIDNFFVKPNYQKQGIGTAIQKFVMQVAAANNRSVILVADGEDTPREMYKRQGYEFKAFQYAALRSNLFSE